MSVGLESKQTLMIIFIHVSHLIADLLFVCINTMPLRFSVSVRLSVHDGCGCGQNKFAGRLQKSSCAFKFSYIIFLRS